jgi:hypothetical protein
LAPQFSTAVSAFVAAGICYLALGAGREAAVASVVPPVKA